MCGMRVVVWTLHLVWMLRRSVPCCGVSGGLTGTSRGRLLRDCVIDLLKLFGQEILLFSVARVQHLC